MKKLAFFSYKGGAGRSTLAFNTIPYIAQLMRATPEHPIILLDMDVDSAGMTFLLKKDGAPQARLSLKDLLQADLQRNLIQLPIRQHPIFSKFAPVGTHFGLDPDNNASILFVPTAPGQNLNPEGTTNYEIGGRTKAHFKDFIELCAQYGCTSVIFDTPAGDQGTASLAMNESNDICVCMRITSQFRLGTIDYLKRKLPEFRNKRFIIVPNAVPTDEIVIENVPVSYENIKQKLIADLKSIDPCGNEINIDIVGQGEQFFGVNEVKRFKIEEGMLFKFDENAMSADEIGAKKIHRRLAQLICQG